MTTPKKSGRPSSYRPEYNEQARKLCLLGLTDVEMADVFNVSEKTFNTWKKAYPEFLQSIKRGKDLADADIAASLYERAKGYSHEDLHFSAYEGCVTATPYTKHYPPDTAAAFIWLKNRQGARWKDKSEVAVDGATIVETLKQLANKLPD
jgi:hypothetical protein